ncbi:DUF2608 domain-containing protein [Aurantimonas marianensis]|uniref:DUF2608 domain-containing protein n=1 Tax=Aurantimonas marianensis TaxID=2920428 RepID=A0A9X2H2N6_9HYPH|nr:DUF2608 domain-containing protein [Aurantimonas marianensis]
MSRGSVTAGPPIASLTKTHDALLVLDVDEVVLEFIDPFGRLLEEHGARLHPESFRLTGNVRSISTGAALAGSELDRVTQLLYETQEKRQPLVAGVDAALDRLSKKADILFLTAMTPSYYPHRRALLDSKGLPYPMIATERSKGAIVAELAGRWRGPLIFADDLPPNLAGVRKSVPDVHLVHLMANTVFRPHLPALPAGTHAAAHWNEAEAIIEIILGAVRLNRTP